MFKWLHNLFCCECKGKQYSYASAPAPSPSGLKIGSVWCPKIYYQNPFQRAKFYVKVKEVREGWVLISMQNGVMDSFKVEDFEYSFVKVE